MAGRNEVTIDVVVRERGGKRTLKELGDESKKTGASFTQMAKDAKGLQKQIFETDIAIRKMAMTMERTGDTSLVKAINKQRREMNALVRIRRDVLGIEPGKKDDGGSPVGALVSRTARAGGQFGSSLTQSLMAMRGPAIVGALSLGAALSPFLGGVIASAVLGGTGAGGIIGGLLLASRDSRVQDAGAKLGQHALFAFSRSAEPFVAPAIAAMGVLRGVVDDVSGDMRKAFAAIAPVLVPLTQGIGGMFDRMMPGVISAMEGARPVLLMVSRELPKIGAALGFFLSKIAEDPRGAIQAFHDLSRIIQATIVVTANFVALLSKTWAIVGPAIRVAQGDVPGMVAAMGETEKAMSDAAAMGKQASDSILGLGESTRKAKEEFTQLDGAIDSFLGKQLSMDEAIVRWHQGLRELKKELTEGKRTLALNTEEGLRNREAIHRQIDAAILMRQKTFEQTGSLEQANAEYQNNITTLRRMGEAAGFSRTELDKLFAPYVDGPRIAITEYRFPGLLAGLEAARQLAALTGSASSAARFRAGDTSGYGGGRAGGGLIMPGMEAHVGETGIERIRMLRGGGAIVYNNDQTMSGFGRGAVAAARPMVRIAVTPSGNAAFDALVQAMWPSILKQVSIEGGDLTAFGAA